MKTMMLKKLFLIVVNVCLILSLASCGKKTETTRVGPEAEGVSSQQKSCSIAFAANDTVEEISSKAFRMGVECQLSEAQVLNRLEDQAN